MTAAKQPGQNQTQEQHTTSDATDSTAPFTAGGSQPTTPSSPVTPTPPVPKVPGKKTRYTISTKTSDVFGAGTDANVFVQMTGEQGFSDVIPLKNSENHSHKFQRNQSDIFITEEIGDVGPITEIHIWHDNKGLGASWHLDTVEVCDACSNVIYQFKCNRWLSKIRDDGQLKRVLQLSGTREKVTRLRSLKLSKKSLKEAPTAAPAPAPAPLPAAAAPQQQQQTSENDEAVTKTPPCSPSSSATREPDKTDKRTT